MGIIERARLWIDRGTYKEPIDSDNIRVPRLEIDDAATFIDKDASNNMTFEDAVTGSKTLAQLSAGAAGAVDTSGIPVDDDFAKFTDADTIEGRSYTEVKQDLSLDNVENTAHSTDAHTMTIDGRDVSVDGTKLDGIEALADVTDATNVNVAGAVMESDGISISNDGAKTTLTGIVGDYNRIGDAATTQHFLDSEDDLMVTGKLEVGGNTYIDGVLFAVGGAQCGDDIMWNLGGSYDCGILYETADADAKCLIFYIDESDDAGNNVPAFVFGEHTAVFNRDLGLLDGIVEGTVVVINNAYDAYVTLDAGDVNSTSHGLYFKPAADEDVNILKIGVTGTPAIIWDESDADFAFNKGLDITGNIVISGTVDGVDVAAHASRHTDGTDDVADLVGANGGAGTHGLVPAPAAGDAAAGKYLKADGVWTTPAGGGDVTGPASSTDNEIARQHSTTGKILQTYTSNPPTISDTGDVNIDGDLDVENIVVSGNVDGVDVSAHAANTTTAHGAVSAATASKHVVRDASARAKFAAPNAAGDVLIKGTRVTTAELPAMTDEKIWKGTGTNVEEITVPPRTACKVVATNDATADVKAAADATCSGSDNHVQIQAALDAITRGVVSVQGQSCSTGATITIAKYKTLLFERRLAITPDADFDVFHVQPGCTLEGGHLDTSGISFSSRAILVDGGDAWPGYNVGDDDEWGLEVRHMILKGGNGAGKGTGIDFVGDANGEKIFDTVWDDIKIIGFEYGVKMIATYGTDAWINSNKFNELYLIYQLYPIWMTGQEDCSGNVFLNLEIGIYADTVLPIMCAGGANRIEGIMYDAHLMSGNIIDFDTADESGSDNWIELASTTLDYIPTLVVGGIRNNVVIDAGHRREAKPFFTSDYGIELEETLSADLTWSGPHCDGTAGEALAFPNAVYMKSDGKYGLADADSASTMPVSALVLTATIANNAAGKFILPGSYVRYDTWDWTIGGDAGLIYASCTAGELTQTKPSGSGDKTQPVAVAITATIIYFLPVFAYELLTGLTGVIRADAGVPSVDSDVTDIVTAATLTAQGKVELATGAETNTGTDATRAVTPDGLDDWTGSAQIVTVGTLSSGDVTAQVSAASEGAAGKIELATLAEVNAGTDTARAVTPDKLSGSLFGKKTVSIKVFDDATAVTTGDGKFHFFCPETLNGMNLVAVSAGVSTVSSSGLPTVQIHNLTDTSDMLSTVLTIDANEKHSKDAANAAVINAAEDDVVTGDELRIDVDVAGTGTKGLQVDLIFQLP